MSSVARFEKLPLSVVVLLLAACGGGGGSGVTDTGGDPNFPPPGSNANYYCPDSIAVDTNLVSNSVYDFSSVSGDCIGAIQHDTQLDKKLIPLEVTDLTNAPDLVISTDAKVTKTGDFSDLAIFYITFEITNNGASDYCAVRNSGASLVDIDNNELGVFSSSFLKGDLFYRNPNLNINDIKSSCIPAGETKLWTVSTADDTAINLLDIDKIVISKLEGSVLDSSLGYIPLDALTATQFEWDLTTDTNTFGGETYITYTLDGIASFVNNLTTPIKLVKDAFILSLFDEEGYMVYEGFATLHGGLGLENKNLLTVDDYTISAGEALKLKYSYSHDSRTPQILGRASKARIQLEWELAFLNPV